MELILSEIIGSLVGCLVGCLMIVIALNMYKLKPSIDYKELIKQSKERLEMSKKYSEELDRMLKK